MLLEDEKVKDNYLGPEEEDFIQWEGKPIHLDLNHSRPDIKPIPQLVGGVARQKVLRY